MITSTPALDSSSTGAKLAMPLSTETTTLAPLASTEATPPVVKE